MKMTPELQRQLMIAMLPGLEYTRTYLAGELRRVEGEIDEIMRTLRPGSNGTSPAAAPAPLTHKALPAPKKDEEWITAKQGATLLGIRESGFNSWVQRHRKKIRRRKMENPGRGNRWLYYLGDVRKLDRNRQRRTSRAGLPLKTKHQRLQEVDGMLTNIGAAKVLGMGGGSAVEYLRRTNKLAGRQVSHPDKPETKVWVYDPADVRRLAAERKAAGK